MNGDSITQYVSMSTYKTHVKCPSPTFSERRDFDLFFVSEMENAKCFWTSSTHFIVDGWYVVSDAFSCGTNTRKFELFTYVA